MKAKTNELRATESTIEIHAKGHEVLYIGRNHYSTILRAIELSNDIRKNKQAIVWRIPIQLETPNEQEGNQR